MKQEFIEACKNGDLARVKDLLTKGVDPSTSNNYAIGLASRKGHIEIVKLLLADPRVDDTYMKIQNIEDLYL